MTEPYDDVTSSYRAYPRACLEDLDRAQVDPLVIGDLIRTPDGRILIPDGPVEANLFAVYAGMRGLDDSATRVVHEFPTLADAEDFLDEMETQGWSVRRWSDWLGGLAEKLA